MPRPVLLLHHPPMASVSRAAVFESMADRLVKVTTVERLTHRCCNSHSSHGPAIEGLSTEPQQLRCSVSVVSLPLVV
eukprot:15453930-Alexandrium_andersonii.AAC.1